MISYMAKPEDLAKLEEKIKKLKEKKKKLERKIKRDILKALTYAKEFSFCYLEALAFGEDKRISFIYQRFIKCISEGLCRRSKDKAKCFQDRLEFVLQYKDFYPNLAIHLLHIKNWLPKFLEMFRANQDMQKQKQEGMGREA